LSVEKEEIIPSPPLNRRRRLLGIMIPVVNLPIFLWKAYDIPVKLSSGMQWTNQDMISDLILLLSSLALIYIMSTWTPVFTSRYWFTDKGIKIKRLLKKTLTIDYGSVARVEIYVKNASEGTVSKQAIDHAKNSASKLRKSGFKFSDYTNDDNTIALLICDGRIYMISPLYSKAFTQKLRKKVGKLPVKMIELTSRGTRERAI